jgi:phage terminase large subunit GpA-like protein
MATALQLIEPNQPASDVDAAARKAAAERKCRSAHVPTAAADDGARVGGRVSLPLAGGLSGARQVLERARTVSARADGSALGSARRDDHPHVAVAGRQDGDREQLHRATDRSPAGPDARDAADARHGGDLVEGSVRADDPRHAGAREEGARREVARERQHDPPQEIPRRSSHRVGANSPASLASRPIRDVVCDEVDRYPVSAGAEGDPIGLVFRRQSTFADRKRLLISSPTIKGQSRIEKEYEASDQRKWIVPCPHCNEEQLLVWGGRDVAYGLKWDEGKPETAHYVCQHCGCVIEEMWKNWMNARGRWRVDNPGHPRRGYWTNALVSPWARWRELVEEFLRIKHDAIRLRQFVNTVLCETWEDDGAQVEAGTLADRCLPYPAEVPAGVAVLVRTVDTQGDRLETSVWGFGDGEEAWIVEHELIPGDPGTPEPWIALDAIRARGYQHESGAELRPRVTFIDSGGHHAKEVYAYTRLHQNEHVYACKGSSLEGHPLLGRPTRSNSAKAILYMIGTFTAKESIMSRLSKIKAPGPGYIHLPEWYDEEHRQQLTAEKLVTRIVGGRPKRVWIKTRDRNEQLDLFAYALAALQQLGPAIVRNLGAIAKQIAAKAEQEKAQSSESPAVTSARKQAPARRSSWVNRWKE